MYAMENKYIAEMGRVNATDKDQKGGDNWKIKYTIVNPSGHFAIRTDPVSNQGIISVVKVRLLHKCGKLKTVANQACPILKNKPKG